MRRKLTTKLENNPGARLGGFRSLPIPSRIALGFLLLIVTVAVFAPFLAKFDPLASGTPVQPPGAEHWFGTDAIGRDIFSRVAHGARASLIIGLFATGIALLCAAVLGSIAATANKVISEVLMRILDVIMSFPGIALAAVFVAVFGNSVSIIVFAIAFLYVPQLARVVRANILSQYSEDYVNASRVVGASTTHILIKHVARNCMAPILVFATVLVADAIVFEASLSFINAGVKPPSPSWGNILADGKALLLSGAWWPTFFPGLMILLTVLSLNILSEGMTDTLASPKAKPVPDSLKQDDTGTTEEARQEADAPVVLGQTSREQANAALAESLDALANSEYRTDNRMVFAGDKTPLIEVRDLKISFPNAHGEVTIVDGVNFTVAPGQTLSLIHI